MLDDLSYNAEIDLFAKFGSLMITACKLRDDLRKMASDTCISKTRECLEEAAESIECAIEEMPNPEHWEDYINRARAGIDD